MNFASPEFAVFFAVTLAVYWLAARWHAPRVALLTVTGYLFAASFDPDLFYYILGQAPPERTLADAVRLLPVYLGPLAAVTGIGFAIVRRMARAKTSGGRRGWLVLSVSLDLALLAVFKYLDFFIRSVVAIGDWVGVGIDIAPIGLPHPVGISFYVFQSIAHAVEVYRGVTPAASSLLDFAAYHAFFPRLVAGPIARPGELLPQLRERPTIDRRAFGLAVFFLLTGLAKKLVVVESLKLNLTDRVFDFPLMFSTPEVLIALFGYSIQIYCDFSGYTDIALGLALLFGISLPANFDFPYQARSVREFWRLWHKTLSFWLRDFLYISLGGSRTAPAWKVYRNLMVTMLLGGLWHGAGWWFIVWGGLHGLGLAATRLVQRRREARGTQPSTGRAVNALKVLGTFTFVSVAWVFFRETGWELFASRLNPAALANFEIINVDARTGALLAVSVACMWMPRRWYAAIRDRFRGLPIPAQLILAAACGYATWRLSAGEITPFVYQDF